MANLSVILANKGEWKLTEDLGVKVLKIRREVLGEDYIYTLLYAFNLAATH